MYEKPMEDYEREHVLNRTQFYHGTNVDVPESEGLRPVSQTGQIPRALSDRNTVYAAPREKQAWQYAKHRAQTMGGHAKVYEVEPEGEVEPAKELAFKGVWELEARMPGAKIKRTLEGPRGTQLRLFPEGTRKYAHPFEVQREMKKRRW